MEDKAHEKARGLNVKVLHSYHIQPLEKVKRFAVPDQCVSFDKKFDDYRPQEFTAPKLLAVPKPVYADPADPKEVHKEFNVSTRKSHIGMYDVRKPSMRPINPKGRTGITGRGVLGKWGPNHAADPLVMRYKPGTGTGIGDSSKRTLQFIAIKRKDTGEWAIPGGMVEFGDDVSQTLRKEFLEETQNILKKSPEQAEELKQDIEKIFANPIKIYKGYVDDPRNTDNAWMETSCTLFFDKTGELTDKLQLEAGDDASEASWTDIPTNLDSLKLYASHVDFVRMAVAKIKSTSGRRRSITSEDFKRRRSLFSGV